MKAQEFIEKKLIELSTKYKEVKIRYEYRANTQSHIVEIIPLSFYENNSSYLAEEVDFENQFEALYPLENIVFISEDSLTEIKNPILELGYSNIIFEYSNYNKVFEVPGYSEIIESWECENYALAA